MQGQVLISEIDPFNYAIMGSPTAMIPVKPTMEDKWELVSTHPGRKWGKTILNSYEIYLDEKKRKRQHSAQKLPDGIKQEDMPKHVVYCSEVYGKDKQNFRDFFRIEKHPNQKKIWSTSKSMKLSIQEKLEQAKLKLEEFN
jgi:hypothetical protein